MTEAENPAHLVPKFATGRKDWKIFFRNISFHSICHHTQSVTCSAHIYVHSEDRNVRLTASPQFRYTTYTKRTAKTRNYAIPHSPIIPSPLDSFRTHLPGTTADPDILASWRKCARFPPLVLTFPEIMHLGSGTKVHYLVFLTNFVHLVWCTEYGTYQLFALLWMGS